MQLAPGFPIAPTLTGDSALAMCLLAAQGGAREVWCEIQLIKQQMLKSGATTQNRQYTVQQLLTTGASSAAYDAEWVVHD